MSGAYAVGSPWAWFAQCGQMAGSSQQRSKEEHAGQQDRGCAPDWSRKAEEWFAAMTGRRAQRTGPQFGGWGMFGGQPPFGPPFGPPWAGAGSGWRAPKARRGDVRAAIIGVLTDRSMNGYQIIQEIADRSRGAWKPSPGSIYPTLSQLEDEGLVFAHEEGGRRVFALTDEGRRYVAEHPDELASPWELMGEPEEDEGGFKPVIGQVAAAMWQIMAVGSPEQQNQGREALIELRRRLHAILAEGNDGEGQS